MILWKTKRLIAVTSLVLGCGLGTASTVLAESKDYKNRPLDVRVERLERLMGTQKQLELMHRMKQLQAENQQLRSLLEEQGNELRRLKQQQRDLYADLNRRLGQMEIGSTTAKAVPSNTQPANQASKKIKKNYEPMLEAPKAEPVMDDRTPIASIGISPPKVVAATGTKPKTLTTRSITPRSSMTMGSMTGKQTQLVKPRQMSAKERKAEQQAYQRAYDELRALRYTKARESFIQFINQYPYGRYAHIAQYWVAESSYAQRHYEQAISDYQILLDNYPMSPKKAESMLKKAYSLYELGDKAKSRSTLNELLMAFPGTTEAGQAKRLLKKL